MVIGPLQAVTLAGVQSGLGQPAAASQTIQAVDDLILHVKNTGSAATVTITDAGSTPGGTQGAGKVVNLTATTGDQYIAIPLAFQDPTTGLITVLFSTTTGITAEWLTR